MKNSELRYWVMEHPMFMVLAIACVHLGKVLANKAKTPRSQHGRATLFFGIALALMIFGTPWPGESSHARPWFRP